MRLFLFYEAAIAGRGWRTMDVLDQVGSIVMICG